MNRGTWWATVHGVTESWTGLSSSAHVSCHCCLIPPSPLRLEDSLCLSSCHPGLPGSGVKATSQDGGFFQEAA